MDPRRAAQAKANRRSSWLCQSLHSKWCATTPCSTDFDSSRAPPQHHFNSVYSFKCAPKQLHNRRSLKSHVSLHRFSPLVTKRRDKPTLNRSAKTVNPIHARCSNCLRSGLGRTKKITEPMSPNVLFLESNKPPEVFNHATTGTSHQQLNRA